MSQPEMLSVLLVAVVIDPAHPTLAEVEKSTDVHSGHTLPNAAHIFQKQVVHISGG